MTNQSNSKDDAYIDRNLAVLVLAKLAQQQGYTVGIKQDPKEPDWPVMMIELPSGQVGWHIPASELIGEWEPFLGEWDGHNLNEKRQRLTEFIKN